MKKSLFLASATLFALTVSASAQQVGNNNFGNQNRNNRNGQNGGAALPLPEGVKSVVSIDALGVIMAEVDRDGQRDFAPIVVRHIYSGGLARLFGGTSIPTEQFVSPGQTGNGQNGNNRGTRFNGTNGGGGNGIGGNGIASTFGSNSLGNTGVSGNTGFTGNNFGNNSFGGNIGSFLMVPTAGGRN